MTLHIIYIMPYVHQTMEAITCETIVRPYCMPANVVHNLRTYNKILQYIFLKKLVRTMMNNYKAISTYTFSLLLYCLLYCSILYPFEFLIR